MDQMLLDIQGLRVSFDLRQGVVHAVNNLDLQLFKGETLGLVGESGCGKSVTALAIMRLIDKPGLISDGKIFFHDQDLLTLTQKQIRDVRGNHIAMIFQDPMTALNPVFTIGNQLTEPLLLHKNMAKAEALERAVDLLAEVGLPNPQDQLERYPHELSGGQRQRVMIAMALSCEPDLLIADEPSTALDVTIQAQIMELMLQLQSKYQTGILLITHDLGVIAEMAQRVAVMYGGDIIEIGDVETLFDQAKHPYTQGLMAAMPSLSTEIEQDHRLFQIPGNVPSLLELPPGCRFQSRCTLVSDACRNALPAMTFNQQQKTHAWRCINVAS